MQDRVFDGRIDCATYFSVTQAVGPPLQRFPSEGLGGEVAQTGSNEFDCLDW